MFYANHPISRLLINFQPARSNKGSSITSILKLDSKRRHSQASSLAKIILQRDKHYDTRITGLFKFIQQ